MLREKQEDIADYFASHGIPVVTSYRRGGLSIYTNDGKTPLARLVPAGNGGLVEVLWYSHRDTWDHIGDFGGVTMSLEKALEYVATDAPGCFGIWYQNTIQRFLGTFYPLPATSRGM